MIPSPRLVALVEVAFDPDYGQPLMDALCTGSVEDQVQISGLGPRRLLLYVSSPIPDICARLLALGGVCDRYPYIRGPGNSSGVWDLILPVGGPAHRHLRDLPSPQDAIDWSILSIGPVPEFAGPTSRQENAMRIARELGYFESPRRVTLVRIGHELGVSTHSAMELLRRGIEAVVSEYHADIYQS